MCLSHHSPLSFSNLSYHHHPPTSSQGPLYTAITTVTTIVNSGAVVPGVPYYVRFAGTPHHTTPHHTTPPYRSTFNVQRAVHLSSTHSLNPHIDPLSTHPINPLLITPPSPTHPPPLLFPSPPHHPHLLPHTSRQRRGHWSLLRSGHQRQQDRGQRRRPARAEVPPGTAQKRSRVCRAVLPGY